MARADAAYADSRVGTVLSIVQEDADPRLRRVASIEPLLRFVVPALLCIFIAAVALSVAMQSMQTRQRALAHAAGEVDLVGSFAARDLANHLDSAKDPVAALTATAAGLPLRVAETGLSLFLSDDQGRILASFGRTVAQGATLIDILGPQQPLTSVYVGRQPRYDCNDLRADHVGLQQPADQQVPVR